MKPEIKKMWIDALTSGNYEQGDSCLYDNVRGVDKFCCLGVLCDLAVKSGVVEVRSTDGMQNNRYNHKFAYGTAEEFENGKANTAVLPKSVMTWAGLDSDNIYIKIEREDREYADDPEFDEIFVSELNDEWELPFHVIAEYIKEQL